ncbi:S-adenosylmethionine decarboxylase proenzyme [Ceratobasidium theobromae]|uniref:adenosylmethionine decarboxylase n=1 Tax=Ceratobasidium theobromae TaxID=1582974 RepID=A0A5N5QTT2_9AGAM|nr:S-adenosylmethionine decarboxylase proenzyme [Ceratobasidium theobromae]
MSEPHVELVSETPVDTTDSLNVSPFEGPEKLLEIWFAESADAVETIGTEQDGRKGLRLVPRQVWEDMLDIVKCKVLSVIEGRETDAYLLSESSFFVSPHKLILKTCGTTLNLYGFPRILEIAAEHCNMRTVHRCFYSRKSFMFPERQLGPHREWVTEVEYLDKLFKGRSDPGLGTGAGYTVGKVNGDHWLLYVIGPEDTGSDNGSLHENISAPATSTPSSSPPDYTIEILMTKLGAPARRPFFYSEAEEGATRPTSHEQGAKTANELGIDAILPEGSTTLDSFAFEPCGYSANALVQHGAGEGYFTIHVTPEEGWSYASFECNVPFGSGLSHDATPREDGMPTLLELIQRVTAIFQPGNLSITLFVSSEGEVEPGGVAPIETAQRVFSRALGIKGYRRTDKINYEFGGYDLAFASFEKKHKEASGYH